MSRCCYCQFCCLVTSCLSFIVFLGLLQTIRWNEYSLEMVWYNQPTSQLQSRKSVGQANISTQCDIVTTPHYQTYSDKAEMNSLTVNTKTKTKLPINISADQHLNVAAQLSGSPFHISNLTQERLWGCYHYSSNRLGGSRSPPDSDLLSALNCSKRVPSAILLGVKKCGSQTLTGFLDLHPDVVSEVFSHSVNIDSFITEKSDDFLRKMPLSTPNELPFIDMIELQNYPQSLAHLTTILKSNVTKYLLILTNPVTRAQSDYAHVKVKMKLPNNSKDVKREKLPVWDERLRQKKEPNVFFKGYRIAETFEKSVLNASGSIDKDNNLIKKGLYYEYVKEILKYVSRDRLLVVDGEQFISNPWLVLEQVENFLGIRPYFKKSFFAKRGKFYCPVFIDRPDADCLKGKGREKKKINQKVKRRLSYYFQPYNQKLKKLLGETFSWM